MPRYFLHVYNRIGHVPDEEGRDFDDLDAATEAALEGVRSVLAEEVRGGALDLDGRIEIADPSGHILRVVPFAEAVEMKGGASK